MNKLTIGTGTSAEAAATPESQQYGEAWSKLCDVIEEVCKPVFRKKCPPISELDECIQQVRFAVFLHIKTFDPSKGSFRAWVWGICKNTVKKTINEQLSKYANFGCGGNNAAEQLYLIPDFREPNEASTDDLAEIDASVSHILRIAFEMAAGKEDIALRHKVFLANQSKVITAKTGRDLLDLKPAAYSMAKGRFLDELRERLRVTSSL